MMPENKSELTMAVKEAQPASPALNTTANTVNNNTTESALVEDDQCSESVQSFVFQQMAPSIGLKSEQRRKEALWDLFQSECAFLYDHIMVLKNVSKTPTKSYLL